MFIKYFPGNKYNNDWLWYIPGKYKPVVTFAHTSLALGPYYSWPRACIFREKITTGHYCIIITRIQDSFTLYPMNKNYIYILFVSLVIKMIWAILFLSLGIKSSMVCNHGMSERTSVCNKQIITWLVCEFDFINLFATLTPSFYQLRYTTPTESDKGGTCLYVSEVYNSNLEKIWTH